MNPDSYAWMPDPLAAGLLRKPLGTFTEVGVRAGFINLEPGAAFQIGSANAIEVLFLISGKISNGSQTYPSNAAFCCDSGDRLETLKALEPSECILFKLPLIG